MEWTKIGDPCVAKPDRCCPRGCVELSQCLDFTHNFTGIGSTIPQANFLTFREMEITYNLVDGECDSCDRLNGTHILPLTDARQPFGLGPCLWTWAGAPVSLTSCFDNNATIATAPGMTLSYNPSQDSYSIRVNPSFRWEENLGIFDPQADLVPIQLLCAGDVLRFVSLGNGSQCEGEALVRML